MSSEQPQVGVSGGPATGEDRRPAGRLTIARRALAVVLLVVGLGAWGVVVLLHSGICPEELPPRLGTWVVCITLACAVGAALLGQRRRFLLGLAVAVAVVVVLVGWSMVLLGRAGYLEPLPGSAGSLAVTLLVVATLGGALVTGWQWWVLLLLPAAAVGFFHLPESLFDSGVECWPYHPRVQTGVMLLPVAIGLGAAAAGFAPRPTRIVGLALLAAPIVFVAWAQFRHSHPIDRREADPYRIELRALPALPSYRGLRIGDSKERMLSLLGRPDHVAPQGDGLVHYTYGADTVIFAEHVLTGAITRRNIVYGLVIRDHRAETAEGVGIGDNLAVFRRHYPRAPCFIPLHDFDPICDTESTYRGASGYAYVVFENDPIDTIVFEGLPTTT